MSIKMTTAAVAASMLTSLAAHASPLRFTLDDPSALGGDQVLSFVLDSNPTPKTHDGMTFSVLVQDATLNGVLDTALDTMSFADSTTDGSLSSGDTLFAYSTPGQQIFTGNTTTPSFSAGSFDMVDPGNFGPATLDISPLSAAPEPSTWTLMIAGVGLAGWALRRRARELSLV